MEACSSRSSTTTIYQRPRLNSQLKTQDNYPFLSFFAWCNLIRIYHGTSYVHSLLSVAAMDGTLVNHPTDSGFLFSVTRLLSRIRACLIFFPSCIAYTRRCEGLISFFTISPRRRWRFSPPSSTWPNTHTHTTCSHSAGKKPRRHIRFPSRAQVRSRKPLKVSRLSVLFSPFTGKVILIHCRRHHHHHHLMKKVSFNVERWGFYCFITQFRLIRAENKRLFFHFLLMIINGGKKLDLNCLSAKNFTLLFFLNENNFFALSLRSIKVGKCLRGRGPHFHLPNNER